MKVTEDHKKADCPASSELGELFDNFCLTDQGKSLLDYNVIVNGDAEDWIQMILKNRMRRAFEAGYDSHKYGIVLPSEVEAEVRAIVDTP